MLAIGFQTEEGFVLIACASQQQRQTGSSLSIVLIFISVFTVSM
jgi:hypothetical protein